MLKILTILILVYIFTYKQNVAVHLTINMFNSFNWLFFLIIKNENKNQVS